MNILAVTRSGSSAVSDKGENRWYVQDLGGGFSHPVAFASTFRMVYCLHAGQAHLTLCRAVNPPGRCNRCKMLTNCRFRTRSAYRSRPVCRNDRDESHVWGYHRDIDQWQRSGFMFPRSLPWVEIEFWERNWNGPLSERRFCSIEVIVEFSCLFLWLWIVVRTCSRI